MCSSDTRGDCCSSACDACSHDASHQVEANAACQPQPHKQDPQPDQQDEKRAERGRLGNWYGLHWLQLLWR
jgi:hypothetical protein